LTDYEAQQDSWRETREANLASDDGWLTIAALHFLHEGANSFGSSPLNDFVLPEGPERVGVFELRGREVFLRTEEGQAVDVNGKRTTTTRLFPTESIRHDVTVGNLTLWIHYSGDRLAVRMSDPNSDILKNFSGLKWFPVDERYRVPARFIPHDNPTAVKLPNILGDIEEFTSHGSVELTVAGQKVRMLSIHSGDQLWFIFRDLTSGVETYPAARFLYAPAPGEDGWTEVDFNRAYNPPCAFNPYTTCPLPPEPNRLNFRVEAGELTYH
jgi:uncharacterized protein (DUF1684 family)